MNMALLHYFNTNHSTILGAVRVSDVGMAGTVYLAVPAALLALFQLLV